MDVRLIRIDIVAVGRPGREPGALAGDYLQRMRPYATVEVHEIRGVPLRDGAQASSRGESDRILERLDRLGVRRPEGMVVLCDSTGRAHTSEELAETLLSVPRIAVVLGGAAGVDERVRERADTVISFGRITLPHELARVVLVEQLYRAFRIARREPYHY